MNSGYRGRAGYFASASFRGNVPHIKNLAGPRLSPGSGMMPPHHSRSLYHFGQFANSVEIHGDSFVGGLEPYDTRQVKWNKKKYKNKTFPVPQKPLRPEQKGPAVKLQPKPSGGAVKSPQPQPKINTNQPKPEDAAKQPKKSTKAVRKRAKKLKRAAKNLEKRQAQASVAKTPQKPNSSGISQPANPEAKQEKRTATQNGGADGETRDAEVPTPPHKKLKTEEMTLPAELPSHGWRGDTSTMFSCSLCRYYSHDEREMQIHFYSSQHKEVLKHLYIFYPKQRVDFLNNYLLFKKRKMSMEQKKNNLQLIVNDKFKGISQEHFLHRIQAAQCEACNVLIPDVPELLTTHIKSDDHQQNCKVALKNIKVSSLAAAKELLLDKEILQMLKLYISGKNPFKDTAVCSQQGSRAPEVLVAEEDDDDVENDNNVEEEDDDDYHHHYDDDDDNNDEDVQDVPANKDSGPTTAVNTDAADEDDDEEEEEAAEAP